MSNSEWITVGALADGFAPEAFLLPDADLAGQTLTLNFSNGWSIPHRFEKEQLHWNAADGSSSGSAAYRATSIRPGIYFVDFLKTEDGQEWSISLVLDTNTSAFTAVLGCLPNADAVKQNNLYTRARVGQQLTLVDAQFIHGSIDQPWQEGACPHAVTDELIGLRNRYRYSPTEAYEHVYLNQNFYTWQCLKGVEKGLAETDLCHYYKIADQLYLFVWREKLIPTLGVVMIDLAGHRSDGKICGYADDSFSKLSNFRMASHCDVLNRTDYGEN